MNFSELSNARRSVRGFKSLPIPDEVVTDMLNAAVQSPSGGNRQPWHFYVISDSDTIRQIREKAYPADWFSTAPVLFVVCVDAERSGAKYGDRGRELYCIQDTGAAIQSMLLCAKSHGLDTCWCGAFDEGAVAEVLDIPANLRPVALIPTGYGNNDNKKPNRRPMAEVVTFIGGNSIISAENSEISDSDISGMKINGVEIEKLIKE